MSYDVIAVEETIAVIEIGDAQDLVIEVSDPGPMGPPGESLTYVHEQSVPSATWTMDHNLGAHPAAIRFIDSAGTEHWVPTQDTSLNQTIATWSGATTGFAYIKA